MYKISVIICTYNPDIKMIERSLDSLKKQTLGQSHWELIVVENGSDVSLLNDVDLSWHSSAKVILDARKGLTIARLRGIEESKGDVIVFVDDDNVLATDYLEQSQQLMLDYPNLGAIGAAKIDPVFDQPPEQWKEPFFGMLAIRDEEKDHWGNDPERGKFPWGAGLVVRRDVALQYSVSVKNCPLRVGLDRVGSKLLSGGDDGFSWVACEMGFGCGIFKKLQLIHFMPPSRLTLDYLQRLAYGHGFSTAINSHIYGYNIGTKRFPTTTVNQLLNSLLQFRILTFIKGFLEYVEFLRQHKNQRSIHMAYQNGVTNGLAWLRQHA